MAYAIKRINPKERQKKYREEGHNHPNALKYMATARGTSIHLYYWSFQSQIFYSKHTHNPAGWSPFSPRIIPYIHAKISAETLHSPSPTPFKL